MLKKYALVLGGNGAVGRQVVKDFKRRSLGSRWYVLNADYERNLDADNNFIISKQTSANEEAGAMLKHAAEYAAEYDAIICLAGNSLP